MTLVKFKKSRLPWLDNMFTDMMDTDRLLTRDFFMQDKWVPAMNVMEKEDRYLIEIAAPGFAKKDFELSIEQGILKIAAENTEEREKREELYSKREFNYSNFFRSFTLPENVNEEEEIEAVYQKGILKLVLMKVHEDEFKTKKIIEVH